jgi:hypothetical protein
MECINDLKNEVKNVNNEYYQKYKSDLEVKDGLLGYVKDGNFKVIIPNDKAEKFIYDIHIDLCHAGSKKLMKYIEVQFAINGLFQKFQKILKSCQICLKRKSQTCKTKEKLIPINSERPLDKIVIDIAQMKPTRGNYKYILVIIDHFSKLISLTPLIKQDDDTITKALLENWILKFGKPNQIICDNGTQFKSNKVLNLCKEYGIDIRFSSPHDHHSNGLVEYSIRTISDMINTS